MNLLIIGAPGAGKGTMSRKIVEKYHVVHVSTGDMLREAVKEKTEVGLKAQEYMNAGALVPDDIINAIIADRLSDDDMEAGFLFDGYPRNIAQAESLAKILANINKKIDAVINLKVDDEILIKRITGRRLCPKCGTIYNIHFKPSKIEGICNECGTDLVIRSDDNEDSLRVRLEAFHNSIDAIVDYYDKAGIVKNIDADDTRDNVFARVEAALEGIE